MRGVSDRATNKGMGRWRAARIPPPLRAISHATGHGGKHLSLLREYVTPLLAPRGFEKRVSSAHTSARLKGNVNDISKPPGGRRGQSWKCGPDACPSLCVLTLAVTLCARGMVGHFARSEANAYSSDSCGASDATALGAGNSYQVPPPQS